MTKITVELDDGTKVVYDDLDSVFIRQIRPADIRRKPGGEIESIEPGKIATLSIVAVSERKL